MADGTKIEWTDATWTPIRARNLKTGKIGWHCIHKSEGCKFCYSEKLNLRLGTGLPFKPGHEKDIEIFLDEKMLTQPLRWKRPRMIFVCSMTDLFADFVLDEWIDRIFAVMALCPRHTFQVLTKRPERMRDYLTDEDLNNRISAALGCMLDGDWIWGAGKPWRHEIENLISCFLGEEIDGEDNIRHRDDPMPLPNIWFGTSCEDQPTANERVPLLLKTPAAVRWVSAEPLLGEISFRSMAVSEKKPSGYYDLMNGSPGLFDFQSRRVLDVPGLDWVVVGGESGPHARPMNPQWAREIRDECASAKVAFLYKQWGEWVSVSEVAGPGEHYSFPDGRTVRRVGKKRAGRSLDGIIHDAYPEARG
jgi:protein gp37